MSTARRAVAALAVLWLAACAVAPEDQVLTRFFAASRALDQTLLYRLATATFNPRTDGSIQLFTVTDRGVEQRGPLTEPQREVAARSLSAPTGETIDLAGYSVEMLTKQLTLQADVRTPEGALRPGMLRVTLQRAVATRAGTTIEGSWIVTRLQPAPAARTSRAASSGPRS